MSYGALWVRAVYYYKYLVLTVRDMTYSDVEWR